MAATVIVDLPETTTNEINKKLDDLREEVGAKTLGRVLTLVIATGQRHHPRGIHRRRQRRQP